MSLVKLCPDTGHQGQPFLAKRNDLRRLSWVVLSDALKVLKLVIHQPDVIDRDLPGRNHLHVSVQGLAAGDDALIGFVGGHGGILPSRQGFVYGEVWGW